MASILENVKKGLTAAAQTPQLGAQQQAQTLARAVTGKAVAAGATPQLSEQLQAQAQAETMQAQRQLVQQGQQVAAQLGAAEQKIEVAARRERRKLDARDLALRENAAQKVDEILTKNMRGQAELQFKRDEAQVEQMGFLMRLNSEKYIQKLEIEGRKARLDNEISFRESVQRTIFDEELKLLDESLRFKSLIRATERDFREKTAEVDINFALQIAEAEAAGNNTAMRYQAISGIATASIQGVQGVMDALPETPEAVTTTMTSVPLSAQEQPVGLGVSAGGYTSPGPQPRFGLGVSSTPEGTPTTWLQNFNPTRGKA